MHRHACRYYRVLHADHGRFTRPRQPSFGSARPDQGWPEGVRRHNRLFARYSVNTSPLIPADEISRYGLHSLQSGGASATAQTGVSNRPTSKHRRWRSEESHNGYMGFSGGTLNCIMLSWYLHGLPQYPILHTFVSSCSADWLRRATATDTLQHINKRPTRFIFVFVRLTVFSFTGRRFFSSMSCWCVTRLPSWSRESCPARAVLDMSRDSRVCIPSWSTFPSTNSIGHVFAGLFVEGNAFHFVVVVVGLVSYSAD